MNIDETVDEIASAATWELRVNAVRRIPENFGTASLTDVYAAVARTVYVPALAPDFAYVHWRDEYELEPFQEAYASALQLTDGFQRVDQANLAQAIRTSPRSLRVFRLLVGFTLPEFAAASALIATTDQGRRAIQPISPARLKSLENGRPATTAEAYTCAVLIDRVMQRTLFGDSPTAGVRLKANKPDTKEGWATVRDYAVNRVPLAVFLHQRMYGGAFRQLLDATSGKRGDVLEDAVNELFVAHGIHHVRTGSRNQEEIARRFNLTVRPAPDFVVFDESESLRAILECKAANDGGTARDKAARFRSLHQEAVRLGGVPVFAVLSGLGWTRVSDALGPVVRDTDGRVFTLPTLPEMLTAQPFPTLVHQ